MIYEHDRGVYVLTCDSCGADAEYLFDSFQEAVNWKKDKSNGWASKLDAGDWNDLCPDCQNMGPQASGEGEIDDGCS